MVATSGLMNVRDRSTDPWDWSIEEVVSVLCAPNGLLNGNFPPNFPEILRANHITGASLLTHVNHVNMKYDWGIKSIGHQAVVDHAIEDLRETSRKYNQRLLKAARRISPGHTWQLGVDAIDPPASYQQRQGYRYISPNSPDPSPSVGRHLIEPQVSPEVRGKRTSSGVDGLSLSIDPPHSEHHFQARLDQFEARLDQIKARPNESDLAGTSPSLQLQSNLLSGINHSARNGHMDGANAGTNLKIDNIGLNLRENETYTVDETGRKRRKLNLTSNHPLENRDDSIRAEDYIQPGEEDTKHIDTQQGTAAAASTFDSCHSHLDDDTDSRSLRRDGPSEEQHSQKSKSPSPLFAPMSEPESPMPLLTQYYQLDVVDDQPSVQSGTSEPIQESQFQEQRENSQIFTDERGRKRVRPTLISDPVGDTRRSPSVVPKKVPKRETNDLLNPHDNVLDDNAEETELVLNDSSRIERQAYLGPKAMPVDHLFYGKTKMGYEVMFPDDSDTFQSFDPGSDNFLMIPNFSLGVGQRLYVSNRLKYYMHSREKKTFDQHSGIREVIFPYPTGLISRNQRLSMSLLSNSSHELRHLRVDRGKWDKMQNTNVRLSIPHGRDDDKEHFDVPDFTLTSAQFAENNSGWDFLEKWKYHHSHGDTLPLYGESGSENEYDLDTWREMELEQEDKLDRPEAEGPSTRRKLGTEEVIRTIEETVELMIEEWKKKKLPRLERKAWRVWITSRRHHHKREQIKSLELDIERLKIRLRKLKKELSAEVWSSVPQLRKQCGCLQESINDQEVSKWTIGVLELPSRPNKPEGSAVKLTPKHPGSKPDPPLEAGEENLSATDSDRESLDTDMDDFIDNSNQSDGLPVDQECSHPSTEEAREEEFDSFTQPLIGYDDCANVNQKSSESTNSSLSHASSPSPIPSVELKQELVQEDVATPQIFPLAAQTPASPEFIDLTQISDQLDSSSVQLNTDDDTSRTPLAESESLHQNVRSSKPAFKFPPGAELIDLEVEDSEGEGVALTDIEVEQPTIIKMEESTAGSIEPPKVITATVELPELWEIRKYENLGKVHVDFILEQQDRHRLLRWLVMHTPKEDLEDIILQTNNVLSTVIQPEVWETLKALQTLKLKMPNTGGSREKALQRIGSWYISWCHNLVPSVKLGWKVAYIRRTVQETAEFDAFYVDLLEVLNLYQQMGTHGAFFGSSDRNKETIKGEEMSSKKKPKRQLLRFDEEDEDASGSLQRKKGRKYEVPESQEGQIMRENARQRASERESRRHKLYKQFKKTSGNQFSEVVVNLDKSEDQEMIVINPHIGDRIQEHQIEGVQFMWSEIVAHHETPHGCLLAHTMGLGKTMQVVTLLVTIAESSKSESGGVRDQIPEALRESCTLVLCPPSLIDNWSDEFLIWTPQPVSSNVGEIHKVTSTMKLPDRLYEIQQWSDNGGILLLGYTTLRSLLKRRETASDGSAMTDEQYEQVKTTLLERPNIIIADEAHALKTSETQVAQLASLFKSKSRIALTGSPLSNNLKEYYSIIHWICPNYLGSRVEFKSKYLEPIQDGLYQDASPRVKRNGLKMLQLLKKELEPIVHRADLSVLTNCLKGKTEFVLRVPLTDLQENAYKLYVDCMLGLSTKEPATATLWAWLTILRLLCNHPFCFREKLASREDDQTAKSKAAGAPDGDDIITPEEAEAENLSGKAVTKLGLTQEMIDLQMALFDAVDEPLDSIPLSFKMPLLLDILTFSAEANDKVLVFSHSIPTLNFIERMLMRSKFEYYRLDGTTKMQARQELSKNFNTGDIDICLISTRAGGQGLNFFGANRVIIVDETFNPMHEEQAIGRAYRIGQQKEVYVYRLTVGGTFEEALQNQSLFKLQLATRVVDKKNPMRHALKGIRDYLFTPRPVEQKTFSHLVGKDPCVLDRILAGQEE